MVWVAALAGMSLAWAGFGMGSQGQSKTSGREGGRTNGTQGARGNTISIFGLGVQGLSKTCPLMALLGASGNPTALHKAMLTFEEP